MRWSAVIFGALQPHGTPTPRYDRRSRKVAYCPDTTIAKGPEWRKSSVPSSMRFPGWCGLRCPTGTSTSLINTGANTPGLALASRLERVGRLRPISKTCLICSKLAIRSVSWRGEYNGSAPAALDGEYRWFAFRIRPLVDASGKIVKWCGLNIVIEDRRRSEEVMQRAREDHYRSIADSNSGPDHFHDTGR